MNTKKIFKKILPHAGVLLLFFLLVLVYFYPAFEGKVLQQSDMMHFKGVSQEIVEYDQLSGWTGSIFSGMPTYHTTGYEPGINFTKYIYQVLYSETGGAIFVLLVTAYLLFLILGAPWWLAAIGAIATAFSSYNIIILAAGHITKVWGLAFVPLVLSGIFLIFKKKYWSGFLIFALGLSLLIIANHLQITYYTALFCFILFIGFLTQCLRKKEYKNLGVSSGILALGVAIAILSNLSSLYINYESGQESLRGKSELTPLDPSQPAATDGLDKDYAFAWSYGIDETFTLLIPNVKGGTSRGTLGKESYLYKEMKKKGYQVGKEIQTSTYWGDKPFTEGAVYFGAVICFLFLFALFILPGNFKWWLLGATVFFIFLSWGRHFIAFNDFMFYHFPFYNKFRTVEMALVIPGFTFPLLAVLGVNELIKNRISVRKLKSSLFISSGITAGICFLFWITPGTFFSFESLYDSAYGLPDWYIDALIRDRETLLKTDALRSLLFIVITGCLLALYIFSEKKKKILPYLAIGLIVLTVCDLWQVDKRYLNANNFTSKRSYEDQLFTKTVADNVILQDTDVSYRVLNLNNTFQDSRTSYYHKSIGGYNAAKLGRYQDLIDRRLSVEINSLVNVFNSRTVSIEELTQALALCPSLNMLNAKYIIYNPDQPPLENSYAFGNAWFVNSYRFVDSPDEEMNALNTIHPLTEAVLDKQFKENIGNLNIIPDENASIKMTAYYPNKVEYQTSSTQTGLAVFSEIYYKNGWKAYIDGERVPISRADWILRAIIIPSGNHKVEFVFDPDNVNAFGKVTTVFSGLLILLLLGSVVLFFIKRKTKFT
ncbi:YfhO family protein [Bacteroidales bacterium OttesenSCG-928-M06]|nr:YfhO family protein [Bacteroidales bacterium OttesenSCG-928-M06]